MPAERRQRTEGLGGDQVEGRQAVRELLVARRRMVHEVVLGAGNDPAPILEEIADLATEARVPMYRLALADLAARARTEAPQGVIARAEGLLEMELGAMIELGAKPGFFIVLDGVTDPQNLGAVLRCALGAGVSGVVLPRHRAAQITPSAAKAAAGAIEYLNFSSVPGIGQALNGLKRHEVWTVGLDAHAERPIEGVEVLGQDVALVLGAEGPGLSALARKRCDVLASIPLSGPIDSLNVAAAAAVACFSVARHRREHSGDTRRN